MSDESYVWHNAKGQMRGQSIQPLDYLVTQAVELDPQLHELLALIDAIRVGRAREKNLTIDFLKQRIC